MNSSSSPKWLALLVTFLVVIGIPATAIGTFHDFFTTHLLLSLAMTALYEVGVVILGSLGKVWQRLESRWVERFANWIDVRVQWKLSGSHQQYCQHLFYLHRDFDVKGLSTQGIYTLLLDQVFVELSLVPRAPHQTSADPIQMPPALSGGSHPIWDYLTSPSLANEHLVILGPPGSGKTTLLKHITLTLLALEKRRSGGLKTAHKLPIFLFLRDHIGTIRDGHDFSLEDAVQNQSKKWKLNVPEGWMKRQLEKGHCLVLLDGLDEVADPEMRQKVVNWVQQQMIVYGQNRFIITSRPFGYHSTPLSGVAVLEVHPFTPEQVERFIHNWYYANELMSSQRNDPGVDMAAKKGAEDLLHRLRNTPALLALAVNPLLLTMIATVHRYRSSLPGKRVELYAEICEVFLGKRQEARGLTLELTAAQQQRVLQPLAYHLMNKGIRVISLNEAREVIKEALMRVHPQMSPEAFLRLVEQGSGLLLERENGVYSFAHLTFQEYLAAVYIRENKWENVMVAHVGDNWWHETIRLYSAQADATAIITACLTGNPPSVPALTLALECQTEALEVQPAVRTQLDMSLNQDVESKEPERQRVVAEALLARRLHQTAHLNEEIYIDTSLITCAEYQLFLNEQQVRGLYYQPDHWEALYFQPGQGRSPVLGVRRSDAEAFCTWLTERDPGAWTYRLPQDGELEEAKDQRLSRNLEKATGYWMKEEKGETWIKGNLILADPSSIKQARFALTFDLALSNIFALDTEGLFAYDLVRIRDFALALDPELALAFDPAFDSDRARTLERVLDRARTRVLSLDSDLALSNLEHARSRAHDLTPILERALEHARTLEHTSDLDSARILERTLEHARTLEHTSDLESARTLVRDLAHDLDSVRAFDLAHVRDLARVRVRDLAGDLEGAYVGVRDLALTYNIDLNIDVALDRVLALARNFDLDSTIDRDLDSTIDRDLDIAYTLEFARTLAGILKRSFCFIRLHIRDVKGRKLAEKLCECVCSLTKALVLHLSLFSREKIVLPTRRKSWPIRTISPRRPDKKQEEEAIIENAISIYLNIYVTFSLLEKRIQGTFPPCEGILIVKERRKENH